jgi:hypothetical protein
MAQSSHPPNDEPSAFVVETSLRSPALERHYSVQEIAALWQVSEDTARRLFQNEPGVIEVGQRKQQLRRRSYRTFRVPQSVLERVHRRCSLVS